MPFPVLSRTDFSPTGATIATLSDYFNPTKNTEFYTRRPSRVAENLISGLDYMTIFKNFVTADTWVDLFPYVQQFFGNGTNYPNLSVAQVVFDLLPEDAKWLMAFCYNSAYRENLNGTVDYRVSFRSPTNRAYGELSWDTSHTMITTTRFTDDLDFRPTPEAIERFKNTLTEQNTIQKVLNKFATWVDPEAKIQRNGQGAFSIPFHIYAYASGLEIFNPRDVPSDVPVRADWRTPQQIAEFLSETSEVTVKIFVSANGTRLNYTPKLKTGGRKLIERVLSYSANVFDYLPFTIKGPKEPQATLYGVELEACGDYTPKQLVDAQKDLFFIMKQDSSIYGSKPQKYELVTIPASLRAHKRLWAEFFEKVDYNLFDTSKDTGNGMHVHIGRNYFTEPHLNRFTWFITNPAHEDFILAVSERPSKRNLDEWARMPNLLGQSTRLGAAKAARRLNERIRGAVHFKGHVTVEVRLFKGIVSYATIVKNLEFVDSVFEYTRTTPLCQISLKSYFAWLDATPKNKYLSFKAFLGEVKTKDFLVASEIQDYLWNKTYNQTITEALNKAPFKVTNAHITVLNKKRKKRTFIIKDGQIVCTSKNGGILAKLDKTLQQKQTRGAASFSLTEFAV